MTDATRDSGTLDARQLGILVKMLHAEDSGTRDVASRALRDLDPAEVAEMLKDPVLPARALVYFARHAGDRLDWIESLLSNPTLPDEDRAVLTAARAAAPPAESPEEDEDDLTIGQRIGKMKVGEKIKLAMKGDKEARTILVKDHRVRTRKVVKLLKMILQSQPLLLLTNLKFRLLMLWQTI